MVVESPPQPPVTTPPKKTVPYREPVPPGPPEDLSAAWVFLWALFAFKVGTIGIILWINRSEVSTVMIVVSSWYWLVIPVIALAGPVAFRWRLLKQRRRAAALRRSEWLVEAQRRAPEAVPSERRADRSNAARTPDRWTAGDRSSEDHR